MLTTTMIAFFFQAEDGIRDLTVTGVQTCALPILSSVLAESTTTISCAKATLARQSRRFAASFLTGTSTDSGRSEEHTSELQSQSNLVCRLLLEKKKNPS